MLHLHRYLHFNGHLTFIPFCAILTALKPERRTMLFRPISNSILDFLGEPRKLIGMTRKEAAKYLGVSPNYVSILTGNSARGNRISKPYTKKRLDQYLESKGAHNDRSLS